MTAKRLTFGVEFEFNLATLAEDVEDPEPQDPRPVRGFRNPYQKFRIKQERLDEVLDRRVKKKVAKALNDAGMPTIVTMDPDDENRDELTKIVYPWLEGKWVVTTDCSVFGVLCAYDWWSIEINSPPLMFCPEALDAVALVCKTLTSNFRCFTNESCGLHIHVGNGSDNFSGRTLKKLMAFLWSFEPVIDQIHPPHRHNHDYCRSIRQSSLYGDILREDGQTVTSVLSKILEEKSKNTLLRRMGDAYTGAFKEAYYTGNLRPTSWSDTMHHTKVTLEFRQHEGTLDGRKTVYWIQLVVGLFEFVENCDFFTLMTFLFQHTELEDAGEKGYEIQHLLKDIGLEEVAEFYAYDLMTSSS